MSTPMIRHRRSYCALTVRRRLARRGITTSRFLVNQSRFDERSGRMEARIYDLEQQVLPLSTNEQAEYEALKAKVSAFVEQYDASQFSDKHQLFKQQHNEIFSQLCLYCQQARRRTCNDVKDDVNRNNMNVFYLDGPDGGSTKTLQMIGFPLTSCFVPNRHKSTCDKLKKKFPDLNVVNLSAQDALTTVSGSSSTPACWDWNDFHFGSYYLDGCGSHVPILLDLLKCLKLGGGDCDDKHPIAIGISLVGGIKQGGGRGDDDDNNNGKQLSVVDKELMITQELVQLAKPHGFRVEHVLDDLERYDVKISDEGSKIRKADGNTLTTWFMLVKDSDG
jgi:hypothetical protein